MSREDRRRFESQVRSLREIDTLAPGSFDHRRDMLALINSLRARAGDRPLPNEDEEPPEHEFYRRAVALGMVAKAR